MEINWKFKFGEEIKLTEKEYLLLEDDFKKSDTDKDGFISQKEFVEMFRRMDLDWGDIYGILNSADTNPKDGKIDWDEWLGWLQNKAGDQMSQYIVAI